MADAAEDEAPAEAIVSTSYAIPEFTCWAKTDEEMTRAFIFQWFATDCDVANYESTALVRNMEAVFQWLRTGAVPAVKPTRALKAVTET